MKTPGPATNLLAVSSPFPQKEQRIDLRPELALDPLRLNTASGYPDVTRASRVPDSVLFTRLTLRRLM